MESKKVIFDDIGSYPLREGITKEWVKEAFAKLRIYKKELHEIIKEAMWQKIKAGVEVPNYPQFQNMISQFIGPITDEERVEAPLLIKEEEAKILEMDAVEEVAKEYGEEKEERLKVRICVTGPVELYYNKFPPPVYIDVLSNLAKSVGRFIKNTIEGVKYCEVEAVSIDEPSIGIDPRVEEEGVVTALELASEYAHKKGIATQIHLHSPIFYEVISKVEGITVIGMESAVNPSFLGLIEKRELERDDKFLRIGISRTDILSMAAEFNERYHRDVFKEKEGLKRVINEYNSSEEIKKRLKKAYLIFEDRIRYVGPDCGLGSFPNQEVAYLLLRNTSAGIKAFL